MCGINIKFESIFSHITMAFPPLVSSTPPPLDSFGDSEEDEFGDFAAGGIDGNKGFIE